MSLRTPKTPLFSVFNINSTKHTTLTKQPLRSDFRGVYLPFGQRTQKSRLILKNRTAFSCEYGIMVSAMLSSSKSFAREEVFTNELLLGAPYCHYGRSYCRNYLVFHLQMVGWQKMISIANLKTPVNLQRT